MINAIVYDANLKYALFLQQFLRSFKNFNKIQIHETPAASFVHSRKIDLDLAIWGFNSKNPDEIEYFSRLLEERTYVHFVCLVNFNNPSLAERLLSEGASAVAYKTFDAKRLQIFFATLLTALYQNPPEHLDYEPVEVTDRESEIFHQVSLGYMNQEISSRFNLANETVRSHIKALNRKLKAKGREQAVAQGFRYKVLY